MKKFNTEYISNKKADLEELKVMIDNLFTEDSEEWISLFDTSKKNPNYIQVHSDIGILDDINPVINFITTVLHYDENAMEERDFYLIEYRKYENEKDFQHYRAFFDKAETIISYIEKYMNDEEIDTQTWIDVTGEFEDEEDILDVIDNVIEDFENNNKKINGGNNMEKMNHEYFGELDLVNGLKDEINFGDDTIVLWEEDVNEINTTLWYGKPAEITTELLDAFSKFLDEFKSNDAKARKALETYLLEDDEYIVFHKEEIELDVPKDAKEFVECMKVNNIGLWIDGENPIIVDYMIAPEESDEILAVRFNSNFEIMDISWES